MYVKERVEELLDVTKSSIASIWGDMCGIHIVEIPMCLEVGKYNGDGDFSLLVKAGAAYSLYGSR